MPTTNETAMPEAEMDAHPLLALPFVKDDPEWKARSGRRPRCFWAVATAGDPGDNWNIGADYARQALDYMREQKFDSLLGLVADSMILKGELLDTADGRVAIGFWDEIARIAMFGRRVLAAYEQLPEGASLVIGGYVPEPPEPNVEVRRPL